MTGFDLDKELLNKQQQHCGAVLSDDIFELQITIIHGPINATTGT